MGRVPLDSSALLSIDERKKDFSGNQDSTACQRSGSRDRLQPEQPVPQFPRASDLVNGQPGTQQTHEDQEPAHRVSVCRFGHAQVTGILAGKQLARPANPE